MDGKVKAEPGRVGSSPKGGSSGVRDGEVLSGSQESSKKVEAPNAEVVEDWNEKDFILSIEYFAKDCNLPNEGMMPGDIPKSLVSDEDIEKCFGPRSGNKGRNGPKLNNCTGLPQSEVLHLFQAIDGHDKPVNGTLEPGETDERAPSPVDRNLKGAATIDAEQEAPAAAEEGISSEPSEVKPEVRLRGSSSDTSCLPVYVELKDDIAARENSIKAIHANISSDTEALEVLRSSTKSAAKSIALSVGTYKTDKEVLAKLETKRTELAARKQSLETRLEDGGFDEENPEDMNLLQSLEAEEEDLNLSLSGVLTKIEECSARLLQSQTEMKLSRSKQEELKMELERAELKVDNAQVVLRREKALLAFQKEELRCLQPFVESSVAPLIPRWIPTETEVTKIVFRLSSCPVCCLGFHCMNFMPTSCGHAYHPACLAALIAHSGQQCMECNETFHPHWCESWGFEVGEKVKQEWERKAGLLNQRVAFRESIRGLYLKTPKLQSERRLQEGLKRQCLNITYTKVGVERTILTSAAATKVRGISPCSTILSEREEDLRDLDVSLMDTSPVPRTRSKSGKRNLPKGDSVRKVRTRSHVTEAEMSTGIGTPCAHTKMAGDTQSRFLGILDITKCWGPSEGQLTYAGCGRLLRDGRPCGLGLRARKTKESAACSANSQSGVIGSQISSQMGTPVNKSRDRAGHICSQSGEEVQLFHFFIETAEPRHELEVWERAGQELLKMTGQEFFEKYGRDRHSLHKFVSTHLASTPWAITVIGKPSTEGYLRVLSCSRAGITSPIRSCFLVNPPQPHVGIVQIASDSPDRRMSAVGISSSYNSSGSLAALKRLQARVDMIAKEVAEVIATVKLEQEPEEFADSTSDWA
ncbi:hypothetical protein R1sor_012265 [Riccia sorocarpa]|uniref:RING-type domain-containing protein n=1 Tax=Riccia sorocarpa TaxID=122646 RepID=A0ABD3I6L6_9MARC